MEDLVDMTEVKHGPTRAGREIDRTFVNFGRSIVDSGTLEPLETEGGLTSDHRVAWARTELERKEEAMVTYSYRRFTEQGAANFTVDLLRENWENVTQVVTPSLKVDAMQEVLGTLMDRHFPSKTTTRRASDPPWVNDKIRRLWAKRRRIYSRSGRNARW